MFSSHHVCYVMEKTGDWRETTDKRDSGEGADTRGRQPNHRNTLKHIEYVLRDTQYVWYTCTGLCLLSDQGEEEQGDHGFKNEEYDLTPTDKSYSSWICKI